MTTETRGSIAVAEPTIDTRPTLGPIAPNGFIDNPEVALRRSSILALTKPAEPHREIVREYHPGATVLIPIHTDERLPSIEHTLRSLSTQGEKTRDLSIVIADNGISNEGRQHIEEFAKQNGLNHLAFADARPTSLEHKNAAHARNKALELIRWLVIQHPEYRQDGILMLDSDTALLPGAVEELEKTYRKREGTVAVTAKNITVPNIDTDAQSTYLKEANSSSQERALPKLYEQGKHVDISSIVAFGSDVATKTCGLFVDKKTINRLSKPFVIMPNGSSEDMLLTVALNNMGDIWHNPRAVVLDQARETPEQTKKQRKNWGRDHAILFTDLVSMGLAPKGLHILEPRGDIWAEWKVPNSDSIAGLIINPDQLKNLSLRLKEDIANESYPRSDELEEGIKTLERITRHIDLTRNQTPTKIRTDLPQPIEPNPAQTRFSPEALIGLLAGNIQGMHEVQKIDKGIIPQIVFFGVRQAANWK